MSLDIIIVMFALCLFFWRAAADHDREEAEAARTTGTGQPRLGIAALLARPPALLRRSAIHRPSPTITIGPT